MVLFPPVSVEPHRETFDTITCPHCAAVRDIGVWDPGTTVVCAACDRPFDVPKLPGSVVQEVSRPVISDTSRPRAAGGTKPGPARRSLADCLGYLDFDLFLRVVRWIGCLVIGASGLVVLGGMAMFTLVMAVFHAPLPFLICLCIGCVVVPVAWCYAWYQLLALFLYLVEGWAEHGIRRAGQD
jgi:hypothetical protein